LKAERERLATANPFRALGLSYTADAAAIRAAFLALTKEYHPSRFARLGREVARDANEVFLKLKDAYTVLSDDARRLRLSAQFAPATPIAAAVAAPGEDPGTGGAAPQARTPATAGAAATSRTSASGRVGQVSGRVRAAHTTTSGSEGAPRPALASSSGSTARAKTATGDGAARPKHDTGSGAARPNHVTDGGAAQARTATQRSPVARPTPTAPKVQPPPARQPAPETLRGPGAIPSRAQRPSDTDAPAASLDRTFRERDDEYEQALKLAAKGDFEPARKLFHKIAAEDPKTKKYRLQLHYTWGLEHEHAGRFDDARVELQRAIQLDPMFRRAHEALDRLPGSKKPGLLSKLFGK
jgi:hypothetical protein